MCFGHQNGPNSSLNQENTANLFVVVTRGRGSVKCVVFYFYNQMERVCKMRTLFGRQIAIGISAIILAIGPANLSRAGNLQVTNGSFTDYTGGYKGAPSQLANPSYSGAGYTSLTGWTVTDGTYGFLMGSGTADTTGAYSPQYSNTFNLWGPGTGGGSVNNGLTASSPDGGNYLALDGGQNYRGGGISQTITGLTAGTNYDVTFYWAGAQQQGQNFNGATTEQVQVTLGSQVQSTAVVNNASHGFTGWQEERYTFTADSTSDVLNFLAIGTPNGVPPFVLLDGVSFGVHPVPEPGTLGLSALGLLGLVVVRARRRATKNVV